MTILCIDLHIFSLVLDSTAKIADGIIEGNFNNPGNQLQCNAINVVARNSTGNIIHKFKYALTVVSLITDRSLNNRPRYQNSLFGNNISFGVIEGCSRLKVRHLTKILAH